MIVDEHARRIARRRRTALFLIVLGVAGLFVLYTVPPSPRSLYPPCWFHAITGWHCPGCGATRCLHALLHGRIAEAASYNVLFFGLLPIIVFFAGRALLAALVGKSPRNLPVPTWLVLAFCVTLIAFGIARNIAVEPLDRLAPGGLFSAAQNRSTP